MSETYTVTVYSDRTEWCKPNTSTLHRLDGPAIEYKNGGKYWYVEGELHRVDGPAVEYCNGTKEWRVNGKRHRTDGPAVEYKNGGRKEWWVNGKRLAEAEFLALTQPKAEPSCDGKTVEIDGKKYVLKLVP